MKLPSLSSGYILVAVAVLFLCAGLYGGFTIRGWKDGAAQTATMKADLDEAQKGVDAIRDSAIKYAKEAKDRQDADAVASANLLQLLGEQRRAFDNFNEKLSAIAVGACRFNPDADQLLKAAYQAAFNPHPATATAPKAGGSDAADRAPASAARHQ